MAQTKTNTTPVRTNGRARRVTFYVVVGLTLAAMAAYPPLLIGPIAAWLPESTIDSLFGEEGLGVHRVHLVGASLLFWLTIVAMVSQFRRPETRAAPVWAAAAGWVVFLPLELTHLVDPFSIIITLLVVGVVALHSRRWPEAGVTWRSGPRILAVLGAAAGVVYAYQQTGLQVNGIPDDPHVTASHYALMTALAIALSASALLGATDYPGHIISAWTAGAIAMVLGVFFIGHPDQASSLGVGWGVAMVVWALAYLVMSARPIVPELAGSET
jgi:hypothetical protein